MLAKHEDVQLEKMTAKTHSKEVTAKWTVSTATREFSLRQGCGFNVVCSPRSTVDSQVD